MTGTENCNAAACETGAAKERDVQKQFWAEHSAKPTVEAMMLDSKASEIDQLERPEVLSLLGDVTGQDVLELGAGIGRFTGELATKGAKSILAVDFMEASIAENERINGHHSHVSFQAADVCELSIPAQSYDVVFSNWLLMYLSDAEVDLLAQRMLSWLRPGGCVFFRESCFRQSGDKQRTFNPTHYRNPRDYFGIFDRASRAVSASPNATANGSSPATAERHIADQPPAAAAAASTADGPDGLALTSEASSSSSSGGAVQQVERFELRFCKCVDTYVQVKRNQNQICWKWVKVVDEPTPHAANGTSNGSKAPAPSPSTTPSAAAHSTAAQGLRHFLDERQYATDNLLRYEVVYGRGFSSPGGAQSAAELSGLLQLQAGERVLDVGCGVGGSTYHIAETYGVHVHGLDLSVNCVLTALERTSERPGADVTFEVADATVREFAHGSFDVVYSRDVLLHVEAKQAFLDKVSAWLKPGGRILFTDYCLTSDAGSSTSGSGCAASAAAATTSTSGAEHAGVSDEFKAYMALRRYSLVSLDQYKQLLQQAGFEDLVVEDRTEQFISFLQAESSRLEANKEDFISRFGSDQYADFKASWAAKLRRAHAGEQRWGLCMARKPAAEKAL